MRGSRTPGSDIDLGLAVSALTLKLGETRTRTEIAAYCGCSPGNIWAIEQKALRKVKQKLIEEAALLATGQ